MFKWQSGWFQELNGEHTPETEEYGIRSIIYRAKKPFHPRRLYSLLDSIKPMSTAVTGALTDGGLTSIVRSKGTFWVSAKQSRNGTCLVP